MVVDKIYLTVTMRPKCVCVCVPVRVDKPMSTVIGPGSEQVEYFTL